MYDYSLSFLISYMNISLNIFFLFLKVDTPHLTHEYFLNTTIIYLYE